MFNTILSGFHCGFQGSKKDPQLKKDNIYMVCNLKKLYKNRISGYLHHRFQMFFDKIPVV